MAGLDSLRLGSQTLGLYRQNDMELQRQNTLLRQENAQKRARLDFLRTSNGLSEKSYADSLGLYEPNVFDNQYFNNLSDEDKARYAEDVASQSDLAMRIAIARNKAAGLYDKAISLEEKDDNLIQRNCDKKTEPSEEKNKEAVKKVEKEYKAAEDKFDYERTHRGFIGAAWDGIKNTIGASSDKVKDEELQNKGGAGHFIRKMWSKVVDSDNGSDSIKQKMDATKDAVSAAKDDPSTVDKLLEHSSLVDERVEAYIKAKNSEAISDDDKAFNDLIKAQLEKDGKEKPLSADIRAAAAKVVSEHVDSAEALISEPSLSVAKKSEEYKASQEAGVDTMVSIGNGIACTGVAAAAVALTPFTGGTSLAVGLAVCATAGAGMKVGAKALNSATAGRSYDTVGSDLATGAFDGFIAKVIPGGSSAIATGVAKKLGLETTKTVVKEGTEVAAKSFVENSGKQILKKQAGKLSKVTYEAGQNGAEGIFKSTPRTFFGFGKHESTELAKVTVSGGSHSVVADGKVLASATLNDGVMTTVKTGAGMRDSFLAGIKQKGVEQSITYTTKEGATSTVRAGAAKLAGAVGTGSVVGSSYAAVDGVSRGDDSEELSQNIVNGAIGGAAFGLGAKVVSKSVGKVSGFGQNVRPASSVSGVAEEVASKAKGSKVKVHNAKLAKAVNSAPRTVKELMDNLVKQNLDNELYKTLAKKVASQEITTLGQLKKALAAVPKAPAKTNTQTSALLDGADEIAVPI